MRWMYRSCGKAAFFFWMSAARLHSVENVENLSEYRLIESGNDAIYQQKYEEAVAYFKELLSRNPDNPLYVVQLGQIYVRLHQFDEAIAVYQKYLEKDPQKESVLNAMGYAYYFENDHPKSKEVFQKTLSINPENTDALAGLGTIAESEEKFGEAEKYYQAALAQDPHSPTALTFLGNLRIKQKRYNDAIQIFKEVQASNPDDPDAARGLENALQGKKVNMQEQMYAHPDAYVSEDDKDQLLNLEAVLRNEAKRQELMEFDQWNIIPNDQLSHRENQSLAEQLYSLSKVKQDQSRSKEAVEAALWAHALNPLRIDLKVNLGKAYLGDGRPAEAEKMFKEILEEDPGNAEGWSGLGVVAYQMGEDEKAAWLLSQALKLDQTNVAALKAKARLQLSQEKYLEAEQDLQRAALYDLDDASIEKERQKVREASLLAASKKNDEKDAEAYEKLIAEYPNHVEYFLRLAEIRQRQRRYKEAAVLYQQAVRLAPKRDDIRIRLGFAYLDIKDDKKAEREFLTVYESNPLQADALTGLGRVRHNKKAYAAAEDYYQEAILLSPEDPTPRFFLGQLRMDQKRYNEAYAIFAELHAKDPQNKDYAAEMVQAREQPYVDRALQLIKNHQDDEALALLRELIARNPLEMRFYLMVGNIYVGQEELGLAIETYQSALAINPNDKEILKGIGFAYLFQAFKTDDTEGDLEWQCCFPYVGLNPKKNAATAHYYLERALQLDPNDSELYAGLGKVWDIYSYWEDAEAYYLTALSINPKDNAALAYYGSLLNDERRFFAATDIYGMQVDLHPQNRDVYRLYIDSYQNTRPSATIGAYYHEEDEWSHLLHRPAARLRQDGGYADAILPVNEDFNVAANLTDEYYVLRDRINHTDSYSMNIQRVALGFDYDYNPYILIYGKFGIAYSFQYKSSVFHTDRKWLILPALGVALTRWNHRFTAQTFSVADTVEQDFTTNRARLFSGQGLGGEYEYDFGKRRLFGFTASNTWYSDWFHNQAQRGAAWFQMTPSDDWQNIFIRYQFSFGRFNKLTTDYYTYQAQTTHTLGIELSKNWWDGDLTFLAGYQHSWQRSFESGQIITVTPVSIFHFVHREINYAYMQCGYRFNDTVNFGFVGNYSRDTFAYTMWTIRANLNWSF